MAGKRNLNFWKSDWFVGLLVSATVLVLGSSSLLQSLERKAYDLAMGMTDRAPSGRIAIIAIDKQSLDNIGRWPWSREIFADMIEKLSAANAKVITTSVFFSEPQRDAGLGYIDRLIELNKARLTAESALATERAAAAAAAVAQAAAKRQGASRVTAGNPIPPPQQPLPLDPVQPVIDPLTDPIGALLAEAEHKLNTDRRLGEAIAQAGNVALPMLFQIGEPIGRPDRMLPEFVQRNAVKLANAEAVAPIPTATIDAGVIDTLGEKAAAIGHFNVLTDVDGAIRAEPLVLQHFDHALPSLALRVAAQSLNLAPADIQVQDGAVKLGKLKIATDPALRMLTYFYRDVGAFPIDSFYDVVSGKIPYGKYRDKIVLIGPTAAGVGSLFVTPVSPSMASVEVMAHTVSSILSEHFFVAPAWGIWVEYGVFLLVALYLILALPRLSAGMGAVITALLLIMLVGAHFGLMMTQLMWLQLMLSATLLLVGHLLLTTKRFLVTEQGKEKSEAESAESNRMLGLAFQGQGQLDMAFDKFRKCPLDDQLMENLYSLGLDFERKRQFNKAESVFRYMADYSIDFRDLAQRIARTKQLSETVILGGAGAGRTNASTMILDGGEMEKPMLGRYQIEKELGKGAMGVVYLGRDPKINRVVAIKTMALSQEFDEDELVDVKARFFREAETAGRLNHANIVTMFDAGEEHDLAYIAMEFLKGKDLVPQTKPDGLLPLPKVLSIIARVAEALDYAHSNQVVHRDIKPANIMYEPTEDQVKVTDFGIARITDSSKTKTGMVLGTPSYMSPEQLAGKKIDGRSDLFSLGVTLFQMASGKLPFVGESMAQLMFRIASDPHPDICKLVSGVPDCVAIIIDKALVKDPDQRYQTGGEFARDLRACLAALGGTA
ncbi:MAG: serine/threonine-protein kinase [Rhodocyclaceae bacterium]|nr:serine/threonine-protein kinase [Rhodocyclaceae bacterium]MDZ4216669.1 serine/threonine-protein kinase [Rhodocyclaceae bacterium]